jgi:polar amino acid transport system substrate-binding protein
MNRRSLGLPLAGLLVLAACGGQGGSGPAATGARGTTAPATTAPATTGAESPASGSPAADGHLGRLLAAGRIVAFTDPAYPPQSSLDEETGEYEGFDIDVTLEIAERLGGLDVEFTTPDFDLMQAGNWAGRYDMSVGSVTITETRKAALDFTQPYYFTPAQLSTHPDSGITTVEGFAGKTICVGEGTTYFDWLEGTLTLTPEAGEVAEVPEGAVATTLRTDTDCAESWRSGRREFDGWLTAGPTAQQAADDGFPVELVGDPVFFEPLAVAFDKAVADNDSLVARVDEIIGEMHEDGTLTQISEKWYEGLDLTVRE